MIKSTLGDIARRKELIKQFTTRYPSAKRLFSLAGPDCYPTQALIEAVYKSRLPSPAKGQILSITLGETRAFWKGEPPELTPDRYGRAIEYLMANPDSKISGKQKKKTKLPNYRDLPRTIWMYWLDSRPRNMQEVYDAVLFKPWQAYLNHEQVHPQLKHLPAELVEKLYGACRRFLLTDSMAASYFKTGFKQGVAKFYFASAWKQANVHNAMVYSKYLLQTPWVTGAQAQNRIPIALSDLLDITRLSAPELRFAADVLGLTAVAAISVPKNNHKATAHSGLWDVARIVQMDNENLGLKKLGRALFSLHVMTDEQANAVTNKIARGMYWTGLLFNVNRLINPPRKAHRIAGLADYSGFRQFYDRIHVKSLQKALYKVVPDRILLRVLKQYQREWSGIRQRDLFAILRFAKLQLIEGNLPEKTLPAVARFALGYPEPNYSASTSQTKRRVLANGLAGASQFPHLKKLDDLLEAAKLNRAYLLHPGYDGVIPIHAPVFIPAAVAAGTEKLPRGVNRFGPERVPYGKSPYDEEYLEEMSEWDIIHLRKSRRKRRDRR